MTIIGNPPSQGSSFGGLASSALPSLGGASLARPTWKRSLQELAASNMALMSNNASNTINASNNNNNSTTNNAPPTAAAQILLGSRTDFGSLLKHKKQNNNKKKNNNSNTNANANKSLNSRFSFDAMSGGGIEAVVRRHRDGMLERILTDQREQTQRLLDKAVEQQSEDDWKEERNWWRKELVGDRNLVDATHHGALSNHSNSNKYSNNTNGYYNQNSSSASGIQQQQQQRMLVADYNSNATNNNNNNKNRSLYATGCDPKSMQEHLRIVQQIHPTSDPLSVIAGFEQLAEDTTGYKNAWTMLASMLPGMRTPIGASQGAISHFCKQYQTIIANHVKSATLSGQDVSTLVQYSSSSSSMTSTIASYVKLISGSNASVWEILYYCA